MQITLAEEVQGQKRNEARYSLPVVTVGRNPATCQIVFDQKKWPSVSRQHAQFRFQDGRWFLVDTGSSYGTFLDGQVIKGPVALNVNSRVQFGANGPILVVTEISSPVRKHVGLETLVDDPHQPPAPVRDVQPTPTQAPVRERASSAFVELSGTGTAGLAKLELSKEVTRFGREPGLEGAIDAAAAVVSRRHAEIQRRAGTYVLVDLGSFNGTLLNGRRIVEPERLYHNDRIELLLQVL